MKSAYFRNTLILSHILFAVMGLFIYLFNYKLSENLLVQRTLSKQEIVAKAGSLAVENLLSSIGNQLSSFVFSFAKIDEASQIDKNTTRAQFLSYIGKASPPISGIALYDEGGKLIIIENRGHIYIGENQDFSSYDFIQWSKNPINRNKVFISDPYTAQAGSAVGKAIMVLAEPIYFGKIYKGTLAIRILVDDFGKAFINPLVSEVDEDSFILDNSGKVLSGKNALLNKNLLDYAEKQKWSKYKDFINKLNNAFKHNETQATWVFQNPGDNPKEFIVGISKIDVPNTDRDLYMVVSSSKEEIISSLSWLRRYGIVWLSFGVLTSIMGGFLMFYLKSSD